MAQEFLHGTNIVTLLEQMGGERVAEGVAGGPLGNAGGYACWHVARLLVARGARVDALWQAAALGMLGFGGCSPFAAPSTDTHAGRRTVHGRIVDLRP